MSWRPQSGSRGRSRPGQPVVHLDSDAWRVVESQYSPVRVVDLFGLIAAVDVLGLKRTNAGLAFGRSGLLPIAASSLGTFAGAVSLSAVRVIPVITCILYLVSAWPGHRSASVTPRDSRGVVTAQQPIRQLTRWAECFGRSMSDSEGGSARSC